MPEPKNQLQVTVPMTDDSSSKADNGYSYTDYDSSDDVRNSRGELTNPGEDISSKLSHQDTSYFGTRGDLDCETLVTGCGMFFTVFGLFFYLLDMVSDIGTAIYYGYNGQWWQAMLTLVIVYGSIILHTVFKWLYGQINCTGTAYWLRYISSLLVNWPDVKPYEVLCRLEWKLYKSPANNAHLTHEWHRRRASVTLLKFIEGIWEACLQAILQLYLLLPDLYGDLTWTDYLRILSTCISFCSAGAALTNYAKYYRLNNHFDLPTRWRVVLHVWAFPVTVCRLLSVPLLLTVEPYLGLAGFALHFVLYGVYWCRTNRVPRALDDVVNICLNSLWLFISPFKIGGSISYRRVVHTIHFLGNNGATVVWASVHRWYARIRPCALSSSVFTLLCLYWDYWAGYYTRSTGPIVISITRVEHRILL